MINEIEEIANFEAEIEYPRKERGGWVWYEHENRFPWADYAFDTLLIEHYNNEHRGMIYMWEKMNLKEDGIESK